MIKTMHYPKLMHIYSTHNYSTTTVNPLNASVGLI